MRWWAILFLTAAGQAGTWMAEGAQPIRYTVRFPAPVTHYAEVEAAIPAEGKVSVEIFLPVWTPGSYLVREYARNIEDMRATDPTGKELPIEKTRKNRWRVETGGTAEIKVRYKLYCREMSVRTNWVDENFALLNGAATFVTLTGGEPREHDVRIELPAGWKLSISGMRETSPNAFRAADYDTLVDSPILAGSPVVHEFAVDGKAHYLVNQGETAIWDGARAARDTQKIVEWNLKMWGSLPYERYAFLNLIVDSGGGLEHRNSFTVMTGRYATRTRRAYLGWLGLVSHEYFHAWNVKRLRPVELGPFDYENEVYTRNLWVAEGFTDYYTGLNVRRAGLATDAEYLGAGPQNELWNGSLSFLVNTLQTTPGRFTQPLAEASYDAWIKLYRPDENAVNTAISYYTKGGVVAWLLDARIRRASGGVKSLDDAMRLAWTRYSGASGYTRSEFLAAMSETAGEDLTSWFHKVLDTTEELDYSEALHWFGLEFKKVDPPKADNRLKAWAGFQTRMVNGHVAITAIPRGTPAAESGLAVDDEILAIDDWRVLPDGWAQRLEQYAPRDTVEVLISRRDRILRVPLTFGEEPAFRWQIQADPKATADQKRHFDAWLAGDTATASAPAR